MNTYIFYGKNIATRYEPIYYRNPHDYSIPMYEVKETITHLGVEEIARHTIKKELQVGQKILINNEQVHIQDIVYDVADDTYKCTTSKIVSNDIIGLTREQAQLQVTQMKQASKGLIGWFSELKYKF